jgi:hypothetical protein
VAQPSLAVIFVQKFKQVQTDIETARYLFKMIIGWVKDKGGKNPVEFVHIMATKFSCPSRPDDSQWATSIPMEHSTCVFSQ